MFKLFKKKVVNDYKPGDEIKYEGITVKITDNLEESNQHLGTDFTVLESIGIEKIIKKQFLPWFKGTDFKNRNNDMILKGLKLYEINYYYGKIIEKYSPINKEDFFGQFEFCFTSNSEYTSEMCDAVAMQVYVYNGKVVKVSGYDI